jgi:hypothetical protein
MIETNYSRDEEDTLKRWQSRGQRSEAWHGKVLFIILDFQENRGH